MNRVRSSMIRQFPVLSLLAMFVGLSASAANITIVNLDGAGEGFNDPTPTATEGGNTGTTRGQQRLIVFQTAANIWGSQLQSAIDIKVGAKFDPISPCSSGGGVLGFAGPTNFGTFPAPPAGYFASTWYSISELEAVRNTNLNSTSNEIVATFNSDVDNACLGLNTRFWYGIDGTPMPSNRIALLPTVLHELGHGLGFLTLVDEPTGQLANGIPDIWTYFLKNAQTGELWKDMTNAERAASAISDPNLIWDGPNVNAAIPTFQPTGAGTHPGTGKMRMYAPNPLEQGSSVSHWTNAAASPNLLMEPALSSGVFSQTDMTVPLFEDIGWPTTSSSQTIAIADRTSGEATTPMQFTLTRSTSTGTASVVATTATTGSATGGGTDFSNVSSQTVNFTAGSTTATLNVTINNDNIDELDETFVVNLTTPSAGYTISDAQATGTITDDDTTTITVNDPAAVTEGSPITFTVTLSNPNSRTVTVSRATANGTATSGDYTGLGAATLTFTSGGALTQNVVVNSTDDGLDEPGAAETFSLNLSNPNTGASGAVLGGAGTDIGTGSINDNDPTPTIRIADAPIQPENGINPTRFVVTLSNPSQPSISVTASTANGTATLADNDYQQRSQALTFTSGNTSIDFDVTRFGDTQFEADETLAVNLTNPTAGYSIADAAAIGTIGNDDPGPAVSIADASLTENAANMVFTVSIPAAAGANASVTYGTAPIDATPGVDYTAVTGTATINAGATSTTINVPVLGDAIDEWDEQFIVNIAATSSSTLSDGQAVGTIIDNDAGGDPIFRNGFD